MLFSTFYKVYIHAVSLYLYVVTERCVILSKKHNIIDFKIKNFGFQQQSECFGLIYTVNPTKF